jgi:hypothetical protein
MGAKARLETELTGDASPFIQAIEQVEKRAQGFSGRIEGLFKRNPGRRAETAISGMLTDLSSGNIQGAITSISEKVGGLGLAAGVGVSAMIGVFMKAQEQMESVDKAVLKIRNDLARPLPAIAALGSEGISKEIDTTRDHLLDVATQRQGWFQQVREAAGKGQPDSFNTSTMQVETPNRTPDAQDAQEKIEKRLRDLILERAKAMEDVASFRERELFLSKAITAEDKINLERDKSKAEIGLNTLSFNQDIDKAAGDKKLTPQAHAGLSSASAESMSRQQGAVDRIANAQLMAERLANLQRINPIEEKAKLSMSDFLKPVERAGGVTGFVQFDQDRIKAQEAQRLENLGFQAQGKGDLNNAYKYFDQSEEKKAGISSLKMSEKDPGMAMKQALSVVEAKLDTIAKNTAGGPPRPVNR